MTTALQTRPASPGVKAIPTPAVKPYLPQSVNRADAVTVNRDGTAVCKSAHGGTYELTFDPDTLAVTGCGCLGWYRGQACRHAVLAQLVLDTAERFGVEGERELLSAENEPNACARCGGIVVRARWYALPLRGFVTVTACASWCGAPREVQ